MNDKYPKAKGALFVNEDRSSDGNQPNLRGYIEVSKAQINQLTEMIKNGVEPKLQVAAWKKVSQKNVRYMFLSTEAYYDPNSGRQQRRQQPSDAFDDDMDF